MADNTPTRLGQQNNTGLTDALFLKVFAEVLGAFRKTTKFMDRTYVRSIANGKSAQFPLIGRAGAYYHVPGAEITGNSIPQNEKVIVIDGLLVSPVTIADIDEAMNHYDTRREFTAALGEALAQAFDQNIARVGIMSSRSAGWVAGMPGGTRITGSTFLTDGTAIAAALFQANSQLDENFVPENDRYAYFRPLQYSLLAQNTTIQNSQLGGAGVYLDNTVPHLGSTQIVKTTSLPVANYVLGAQSAGAGPVGVAGGTGTGATKYDVLASTQAGLVLHRTAVGTVKLMDVQLQSEYSVRRQSSLMVTRMAVGHGILRPEGAVELVTGVPV